MKIRFKGAHNTEELFASMETVLRLLEERYGVSNYKDLKLELTLLDSDGSEIELADAESESGRIDELEVYRDLDGVIDGEHPGKQLLLEEEPPRSTSTAKSKSTRNKRLH